MPALKLVGIKGKIKKGIQNDNDLEILLKLADHDSIFYSFRSGISTMIIEGWPKSEKVKQVCLESLTQWDGDGMTGLCVLRCNECTAEISVNNISDSMTYYIASRKS